VIDTIPLKEADQITGSSEPSVKCNQGTSASIDNAAPSSVLPAHNITGQNVGLINKISNFSSMIKRVTSFEGEVEPQASSPVTPASATTGSGPSYQLASMAMTAEKRRTNFVLQVIQKFHGFEKSSFRLLIELISS
jgi:hypothetical protein